MIGLIVFGVIWPLIALLVMCTAAFSFPAALEGMREQAGIEANKKYPDYSKLGRHVGFIADQEREVYRLEQLNRKQTYFLLFTFLISAAWPVLLPLYLSWRKGSLMIKTVQARSELSKLTQLNIELRERKWELSKEIIDRQNQLGRLEKERRLLKNDIHDRLVTKYDYAVKDKRRRYK